MRAALITRVYRPISRAAGNMTSKYSATILISFSRSEEMKRPSHKQFAFSFAVGKNNISRTSLQAALGWREHFSLICRGDCRQINRGGATNAMGSAPPVYVFTRLSIYGRRGSRGRAVFGEICVQLIGLSCFVRAPRLSAVKKEIN